MEFRAAIYMSFKKTQCSLSFIVITVIIINFENFKINCHNYAQLFYILVVIDFQSLIKKHLQLFRNDECNLQNDMKQ
jgi:hypothetical protein